MSDIILSTRDSKMKDKDVCARGEGRRLSSSSLQDEYVCYFGNMEEV